MPAPRVAIPSPPPRQTTPRGELCAAPTTRAPFAISASADELVVAPAEASATYRFGFARNSAIEDSESAFGELGGAAARTLSPACDRDRDGTPAKQALPSCAAADAADSLNKSDEITASPESPAARIVKLKAEQAALIEHKQTSKDLQYADRMRCRLKQHSRTLSDDDRVQLLQLPHAASAEASGEATASASSPPKRSETKGEYWTAQWRSLSPATCAPQTVCGDLRTSTSWRPCDDTDVRLAPDSLQKKRAVVIHNVRRMRGVMMGRKKADRGPDIIAISETVGIQRGTWGVGRVGRVPMWVGGKQRGRGACWQLVHGAQILRRRRLLSTLHAADEKRGGCPH